LHQFDPSPEMTRAEPLLASLWRRLESSLSPAKNEKESNHDSTSL
jgi:hypothetical protein